MTPPSTMLDDAKAEEEYIEMASKPGGLERMLAKTFMTVDRIDKKVDDNAADDKVHRETALHRAHPVTRETVFVLTLAVCVVLILGGILTPEQVAAVVPGGG